MRDLPDAIQEMNELSKCHKIIIIVIVITIVAAIFVVVFVPTSTICCEALSKSWSIFRSND